RRRGGARWPRDRRRQLRGPVRSGGHRSHRWRPAGGASSPPGRHDRVPRVRLRQQLQWFHGRVDRDRLHRQRARAGCRRGGPSVPADDGRVHPDRHGHEGPSLVGEAYGKGREAIRHSLRLGAPR
ncbi:unnamed protein product, partial [Prorocentrum cordatum]